MTHDIHDIHRISLILLYLYYTSYFFLPTHLLPRAISR
jgi:hypothetical protein